MTPLHQRMIEDMQVRVVSHPVLVSSAGVYGRMPFRPIAGCGGVRAHPDLPDLSGRSLRSRIGLIWTVECWPERGQEQGQKFSEPSQDTAEVVADG